MRISFEISIWKQCGSNGLKKTFNTDTNSEKYGAFCQQIPTPFQIKVHLQTNTIVFFLWSWHSLKWMFITIRKMFLQESASSLGKLCKISSNAKTKFQISRWSLFVYVMVLLSKAYVIPWRMCAKSHFIFKKQWGRWGRHNIPPRQWILFQTIYI